MNIIIQLELTIDEEIAKAWAVKQDDENPVHAIINDICCTLETATDCGIDNASIIDYEVEED